MRKTVFVLAIAMLTMFGAVVPARADVPYTFTFSDMYYVDSLTTFHSIFGATTTGYGTAGIYQETNTTTPIVTKLSNGSGVPGEYVENTTPNATDELTLNGWSQSLSNGQQVAEVYNLDNPLNGVVLYFQYKTGVTSTSSGNTTPFTFNSFELSGSSPAANLSFTLEGLSGGAVVDTAVLTVTGNTLTTFTENWTNVDTVEIVSTTSLPVNWGSGALYMDNVTINNTVPTPEPTSIALLVTMLGALSVFMGKRLLRGGDD